MSFGWGIRAAVPAKNYLTGPEQERRRMTLGIDLRRDLLRVPQAAQDPAVHTAAAGALALGIGGSAAEFATMDALLLRPMPRIRDRGRWPPFENSTNASGSSRRSPIKTTRTTATTRYFNGIAAWTEVLAYTDGPKPRKCCRPGDTNYFDLLGASSAGRGFTGINKPSQANTPLWSSVTHSGRRI